MARQHGDETSISKLQIEAVQTITPFKPTEPRQTRHVSVTDPVGSGIFRRCFNTVLYFKKVTEEGSAWMIAGRIKESLARASVEQPLLAGRIRRVEGGEGAGFEIVSNDSGLRLIEAKISISLKEFLDLKESKDLESELAFWKDIDEQSPDFSPLCYVQVTNFECGGYSIGISCNILLADLFITENFLKKWADIQSELISKNDSPKTPLFYLPRIKKTSSTSATPDIWSDQTKNYGQTMIFKITDETVTLENESGKQLMLLCVEKAERELGSKMASKFSVFLKKSSHVLKIESCLKLEHGLGQSQFRLGSHFSCVSWDDLGANDIVFQEGNKPALVTHWMGSVTDGLVMALPSPDSRLNIIVSVPSENKII